MNPRYITTEDIEHPCCYAAGVMDSSKPGRAGFVCECFNLADAEMIANALNAQEKTA